MSRKKSPLTLHATKPFGRGQLSCLTQIALCAALAFNLTSAEARLPRVTVGKPKAPKVPKLPNVPNPTKPLIKAAEHIKDEVARGTENVEEGARVTVATLERQTDTLGDVVTAAGKRLRDGKIADAAWHLQADYYQGTEKNALQATQESSMLRMAGQSLASMAFGPAGGAAFSVWYVGRTTDDLTEGLKAGAISFATSTAVGSVNAGPVSGVGDAAGRAVASGTVVGVATEASGGEFGDGFQQGSLASVANSTYKSYTGAEVDSRPGEESVSKGNAESPCVTDDCVQVDTAQQMRDLSPRLNHTGIISPNVNAPVSWAHEGSVAMNVVNKVPYINAGSYLHDIWVTDMNVPYALNLATIAPAMIESAIAGGVGSDAELLKAVQPESKKPRKVCGNRSGGNTKIRVVRLAI